MNLKEISKNIKDVLKNKNYLVLAIVIFVSSVVLLLWLSSLDTLFTMNSWLFIFFSLFSTLLISLLLAINIPLIIYKFKAMRKLEGSKLLGGSFFGVFGGIAGSGCPVCGSAILSFLGVTGGLAIFPFGGLELKALGVGLLGFSFVSINKSLDKYNICIPKTKKSYLHKNEFLLDKKFESFMIIALLLIGSLIIFNQFQLSGISSSVNSLTGAASGSIFLSGGGSDLSGVDISQITSTAMAIASLFPELNNIKDEKDAINIMIPTGAPEYSEALGSITFDNPVMSMDYLVKWYYSYKDEIKQNDPEIWQRYLGLATEPRGISCEFCCGIGPVGITKKGDLTCGCKHNPAVQALTLSLMKDTDYSDAEILREVMHWKALWFPRSMVGLALEVAGTDPSQLKNLPGMVGGC